MSRAAIQPISSARPGAQRPADAWRAIAVCGLLVLAIAIAFGRTMGQGFSNLDDPQYVTGEPHVSGGLSRSGIVWAFTNGPAGESYPVSMLSHMLDCQLYGLEPVGHHLTNVLLHAASAVLLFLVLWRMTEAFWPSAMVAGLFALHPLRVESVAWIAERRDVLSGVFFMLVLGTYDEYVRHRRSLWAYLVMCAFFVLGLLAKPIVVTLPALLLLLDDWPLGRLRNGRQAAAPPLPRPTHPAWWLILEKLPLVALALAEIGVTLLTHSGSPNDWGLSERLANAALSCVAYLGQLFVPIGLSVYYVYPNGGWPAWQVAAAAVLLLTITTAALLLRRSAPYLFVGWFWYLGMLVPVLGLTKVGGHARADRYTYLAQIGLDIALVWGVMRLGASLPARRWILAGGSGLVLAALMACTWRQTGYWQDSKILWQHALACDPTNAMAHYDLGLLLEENDESSAAKHYQLTVELGRNDPNLRHMAVSRALGRLGNIAYRHDDLDGAMACFRQSLEFNPWSSLAHHKLGLIELKKGNRDQAIVHFGRWAELSPNDADAHFRLAGLLEGQGRTSEAIVEYRKALDIDPKLAPARQGLGRLSGR